MLNPELIRRRVSCILFQNLTLIRTLHYNKKKNEKYCSENIEKILPRGNKQTSVLHVLLCTSRYFSVLLRTSSYFLYFSVLLRTSSYFSVLLCTSPYFFVLLCTSLYFSVLLGTSRYFSVLLGTSVPKTKQRSSVITQYQKLYF